MQPDFPMVGDSASSLLQLTDPFPASTTPGTSAATAASTSAATAASAATLPSHEDVIRGNVDANLWGLDDIDLSNTFFEDLDMNFNFASPSTFVASLPAASSATSLPDMSFPSPLATSFAAPVSATSFAASLPAVSSAAASSPAASSPAPISSINPAVFSLNNAEGYRPPRPPPLVPSHAESQRTSRAAVNFFQSGSPSARTTDDSDSDAAAATLIAKVRGEST
ncbi:hypothetical protein EV363DRAFT_1168601 [Boletus edulis]|nr:hypothetical protein EV363DRAFT_1168601 [Boletus edulis]